jgi:hypothetical protein
MALRGNLRDFSLPDVFQLVTFSRKTGVLRILREDAAQGSVWFREGEVFFASSNWHSDPLGERLVTAQRITGQALVKALGIRSGEPADGRRLGQILVDEGYITEKVLATFVQEQIQDTIFDLMRWDDGDFDFESMPDVVDEDIGLTVSIENVVMEGSRRLDEWSRIKKKIPSTSVVFKMATAPGEGTFEISLKPMEWQLLLLIDGTRTIADLATETARTDFEVSRIIYGLFSAGLLEFATDVEIKRNRAEREQREARLAQIEAERRAALQVQRDAAEETLRIQAEEAATARDAQLLLDAEGHQVPAEEPEFLAGATVEASAGDQAALDEFMGAVLSSPVMQPPTLPPEVAAPYVPVEEPAFISASHLERGDSSEEDEPSVEDILGLTAPIAPDASVAAALVEARDDSVQDAVTGDEPSEEPVADLTDTFMEAPDLADAHPAFLTDVEPAIDESVDWNSASGPIESQPDLVSVSETDISGTNEEPDAQVIQEIDWAGLASSGKSHGPDSGVETQQKPVELPTEVVPGLDFEKDLLALGLGELPAELMAPIDLNDFTSSVDESVPPHEATFGPAPVVVIEDRDDDRLLEVHEPASMADKWTDEADYAAEELIDELPSSVIDAAAEANESAIVQDVWPAPAAVDEFSVGLQDSPPDSADTAFEAGVESAAAPAQDGMDFTALIRSLDVDADDDAPDVKVPAEFDVDLLREEATSLAGGVISTDAYLGDIGIDGLSFQGSMTDELSALTGAQRRVVPRPQASVNSLPDEGGGVLQRDKRVDRDTLLRIIDGIKKL